MTTQVLPGSIFGRLSLAPAILAVVFAVKILFPHFWDPDLYWHLKVGESIVAHGALPDGESFTFTHPGAPLRHSEWLFQVIMYLVQAAFGFAGLNVLVAVIYTACWYLTYLSCRRLLEDEAKAIIVTLLFCASLGGVAPRPQLISFLGVALTLNLIVDFKYGAGLRRLWLFPPMMLVWANAHGGYFLGLVLFGLFAATEWMRFLLGSAALGAERARLATLARIALLGLLATLLNPGFARGWWYPFQAIAHSPDTAMISEWQSPSFHAPLSAYFLLTVFAFFVAAARSPRKADLTELAIPIVFAGGAFYSIRNIPYAAMAMAPFCAAFARAMLRAARARAPGAQPEPRWTRIVRALAAGGNRQLGQKEALLNWALLGTTLLALALVYPLHAKSLQADMEKFQPVKATDFVLREGIQGRLFNTYHHGGYLIFRLPASQKVFIYPRTDFYRPGFLKEQADIYGGAPNWKALFGKYDIDYVICEHTAPLRQLLMEGKDFRLVFDDGKHSVLVRDEARFRALIEKYGAAPASE